MGAVLEPTAAIGGWRVEVRGESFYLFGPMDGPVPIRAGGGTVNVPTEALPTFTAALDQVAEHPAYRRWLRSIRGRAASGQGPRRSTGGGRCGTRMGCGCSRSGRRWSWSTGDIRAWHWTLVEHCLHTVDRRRAVAEAADSEHLAGITAAAAADLAVVDAELRTRAAQLASLTTHARRSTSGSASSTLPPV